MIAVTQPIYPEKPINTPCIIDKKFQQKPENPYDRIIAKEVLNWLNHSQLVGIFHLNSISSEDFFKARVAFHKQNMQLKVYGKSVWKIAIADTKYEAILPMFDSKNCIVFCSDQKKIQQLFKIVKKIPQMNLMGGILENRLMSKDQITDYANMPDLTTVQAQFVGILDSIGGQLINHLECHQKNLVNILDTHISESKKSSEEQGTAGSTKAEE